ncbi:MAG: radical SAM protein [archaeon]
MFFPLDKYEEIKAGRRNTLQIFITNRCNLNCIGCFAKKVMKEKQKDITIKEYSWAVNEFLKKGGGQINLLGGEPLMHPRLREIIEINKKRKIKTTIYTNGIMLPNFGEKDLQGVKLRVSIYCKNKGIKSAVKLPKTSSKIEVCYMISKKTSLKEMLASAYHIEKNHNCNVFFISSIRELDNKNKEFFEDTDLTMNLLRYKRIVHEFLKEYKGNMQIHISKRGVFESTKNLAENKCRFANYFIGKKIIQCPYDTINLKFQKSYEFNKRHCQHNNTCLMSKIILRKIDR